MKQKQKQQSSSTGSCDVDDGGGANTAQRWVNRACWMGRQWIPAASSTQQITQHQHHPHPYLGGTSTSDGGGSSYMSGFRLISYNVLSNFKNAYQSMKDFRVLRRCDSYCSEILYFLHLS
jgi:hypothetical protein